MKLIDNWRESWKWFSVQSMALAVALQATWAGIPADLKAYVPDSYVTIATIAILLLGFVGRLVPQSKP